MSRINLKTHPLYQDSYRDFEGMADTKAVLLKLRQQRTTKVGPTYKDGEIIDPTIQTIDYGVTWAWDCVLTEDDPKELKNAVRTIVLNLMYELADTCDIDQVTFEGAVEMANTVREVLTTPEWVEVTDQDIEKILNSSDPAYEVDND